MVKIIFVNFVERLLEGDGVPDSLVEKLQPLWQLIYGETQFQPFSRVGKYLSIQISIYLSLYLFVAADLW